MLWELIGNVSVFMLTWFSVFFLHELCHLGEAYRQGATRGRIHFEFFSMYVTASHIRNRSLFLLSGGLYSGCISIAIGMLIRDPILQFSLLSIGLTNLIYGFYEARYLGKQDGWEYFKGRYSIYAVVIGCCLLYRFSGWFM